MSRVLVTRAEEDAGDLAAHLEALGHEVRLAPLIARLSDPVAVQAGLRACPAPDVLLLTSPAAVAAIGTLPRGFAPVRTACVGPATAEAARQLGLGVDLVPEVASGVDTVAAMGALRGRTVLYVRAAHTVPGTREALDAAGAVVVDVVAYRTVSVPDGAGVLRLAGPVDIITLTAPSIAQAYAVARGAAPEHGLPPVVSIGPTTSRACRSAGLQVVAEASEPSMAALARAVP